MQLLCWRRVHFLGSSLFSLEQRYQPIHRLSRAFRALVDPSPLSLYIFHEQVIQLYI